MSKRMSWGAHAAVGVAGAFATYAVLRRIAKMLGGDIDPHPSAEPTPACNKKRKSSGIQRSNSLSLPRRGKFSTDYVSFGHHDPEITFIKDMSKSSTHSSAPPSVRSLKGSAENTPYDIFEVDDDVVTSAPPSAHSSAHSLKESDDATLPYDIFGVGDDDDDDDTSEYIEIDDSTPPRSWGPRSESSPYSATVPSYESAETDDEFSSAHSAEHEFLHEHSASMETSKEISKEIPKECADCDSESVFNSLYNGSVDPTKKAQEVLANVIAFNSPEKMEQAAKSMRLCLISGAKLTKEEVESFREMLYFRDYMGDHIIVPDFDTRVHMDQIFTAGPKHYVAGGLEALKAEQNKSYTDTWKQKSEIAMANRFVDPNRSLEEHILAFRSKNPYLKHVSGGAWDAFWLRMARQRKVNECLGPDPVTHKPFHISRPVFDSLGFLLSKALESIRDDVKDENEQSIMLWVVKKWDHRETYIRSVADAKKLIEETLKKVEEGRLIPPIIDDA